MQVRTLVAEARRVWTSVPPGTDRGSSIVRPSHSRCHGCRCSDWARVDTCGDAVAASATTVAQGERDRHVQ
jgi:hypothetical protein